MKTLVVLSFLVAAAAAQFFPYGFPGDEQYAASLGNAPVGLYDKKQGLGAGPFGGYGSEVAGASLGGAKVGIYGKENQGFGPAPFPLVRPVLPVRPVFPVFKPALPYVVPRHHHPGHHGHHG